MDRRKKQSPLAAIRRQVMFHQRVTAPPLIGSAMDKLNRENDGLRGIRISPGGNEVPAFLRSRASGRVKKVKAKKVVKRAPPKATSAPQQLEPPVIERWGIAGGVSQQDESRAEQVTSILGVARVAPWQCEGFTTGLKKVLDQHEASGNIFTKEVEIGGESVNEVFVMFTSELEAEKAAKEFLNGQMLNDRELQVVYA